MSTPDSEGSLSINGTCTATSAGRTYKLVDGVMQEVWPPKPVGCVCGAADDDMEFCAPEYDLPGVGAVVTAEAYTHLRRAFRDLREPSWRDDPERKRYL